MPLDIELDVDLEDVVAGFDTMKRQARNLLPVWKELAPVMKRDQRITFSAERVPRASGIRPRPRRGRLRHYQRFSLLVVDEIGYLSYDTRNADLFFQIVSRRYEHKSLVLTTNLAFSDWPTIFPNATCATALIDRLCHHADILKIEGKSYRRREAENASTSRRKRRKKSAA